MGILPSPTATPFSALASVSAETRAYPEGGGGGENPFPNRRRPRLAEGVGPPAAGSRPCSVLGEPSGNWDWGGGGRRLGQQSSLPSPVSPPGQDSPRGPRAPILASFRTPGIPQVPGRDQAERQQAAAESGIPQQQL